jgi:hypothetical protein
MPDLLQIPDNFMLQKKATGEVAFQMAIRKCPEGIFYLIPGFLAGDFPDLIPGAGMGFTSSSTGTAAAGGEGGNSGIV